MKKSLKDSILKNFLLFIVVGIVIWCGYSCLFSKSGFISQKRVLLKIASLRRTADSLSIIKNQLEDYLQSLHRGDR
ncbi:MAG: hypothetical protein ACK4OO_07895, partial [bacterium]